MTAHQLLAQPEDARRFAAPSRPRRSLASGRFSCMRSPRTRRASTCATNSSTHRLPDDAVGVVGGGERRDGLAVVARAHPRALEREHDTGRHGIGDPQREMDLAEAVPRASRRSAIPWPPSYASRSTSPPRSRASRTSSSDSSSVPLLVARGRSIGYRPRWK